MAFRLAAAARRNIADFDRLRCTHTVLVVITAHCRACHSQRIVGMTVGCTVFHRSGFLTEGVTARLLRGLCFASAADFDFRTAASVVAVVLTVNGTALKFCHDRYTSEKFSLLFDVQSRRPTS